MNSTTLTTSNDTAVNEFAQDLREQAFEYRSVHVAAVLGLLIGVLSSLVLFTSGAGIETTLPLTPIPVLGLCVSVYALKSILAAREVYTGERLAALGAILSAFFLITGVGYAGFIHATEVPEGYTRISFIDMKPTSDDVVNRTLIPQEVEQLFVDGEKIFLKGYIRPDSIAYTKNINRFLLVRDNQECCFGDQSKVKYFDQVQVQLDKGMSTDFTRGLYRLGGVMRIGPGNANMGTPLTYYLEADYVNP